MNATPLQPAFILHRRNYRDTSLILELFTLEEGRLSVIAKGAKRNKSPLRNSLQMFQPILVAYSGKSELQTLVQIELQTPLANIKEQYLAWAFYLNELLFRLLQKHDPYPDLFQQYQKTITLLASNIVNEEHLRIFEYDLLNELGYGLQLTTDGEGNLIEPQSYYHCLPQQAPIKTNFNDQQQNIYLGNSLLALQQKNLTDTTALRDSKNLLRQALLPLLGEKPLKSRELLI